MAKKDLIDKVESSKFWGYVAMGAGMVALAGVFIAIKESMDAKKVAALKEEAEKELASVKEQVTAQTGEPAEKFSGCGGCSSASGDYAYKPKLHDTLVSNARGNKVKEKPQEFVSSDFRGNSSNPYASVDSRRKPLTRRGQKAPIAYGGNSTFKYGYDSEAKCKEAGYKYCDPMVIEGETRYMGNS